MQKILVVDDDKHIVGMLKKLLERKSYAVFTASNGEEGLQLFRQEQPDLLITDIVMPKVGGLEAVRMLKKEAPDLKVIAISGGANIGPEAYLSMAKQLGANYTFTKPFDIGELVHAIDDLLN